MKKFILMLILFLSMELTGAHILNDIPNSDNIYGIYNDSCIETSNYLYLFYVSPEGEIIKEDVNIWLENISQVGPKVFKADLYYID